MIYVSYRYIKPSELDPVNLKYIIYIYHRLIQVVADKRQFQSHWIQALNQQQGDPK